VLRSSTTDPSCAVAASRLQEANNVRALHLAAVIFLCAGVSTTLAQALRGSVIVVDNPPGTQTSLSKGEEVTDGSKLSTSPANRVAVYLAAGRGPDAEVGLYIEPESALGVVASTPAIPWHLSVEKGSLLVRFTARVDTRVPLIVSTAAGWARVQPGSMVWVNAAAGAPRFRLVEGAATQFDGQVPQQNTATMPGGQVLAPQADSRGAAMALVKRLLQARTAEAGAAWIKYASQGELVPQPKGATVSARSEHVRVTAVTPPAVAPSTTSTLPISATVTPAMTQAQLLLSSQSPASVLVGARLERTRIVGNPGTAGTSSGLRFNPEVRGPLDLGGK
jgi:hypothetical protein